MCDHDPSERRFFVLFLLSLSILIGFLGFELALEYGER